VKSKILKVVMQFLYKLYKLSMCGILIGFSEKELNISKTPTFHCPQHGSKMLKAYGEYGEDYPKPLSVTL